MLTFFRRIINSKVGVIVTFAILAVIALAFAAGDVTGFASTGGGLLGNSVATVDGQAVTAADVRKRAQDEVRAASQQQPGYDMATLVSQGGVEALVQRTITGLALQTFGEDQGMRVSRALIGSELKNIPAFAGPTGQFDQQVYERLIAQRGMTDAQVQREVARETMAQFMMVPTIGAAQVPQQLALPYASLLLERRAGQVAFIPAAAVPAGPAPTDAEVQEWYRRNIARYTMPERRVIRYARVDATALESQSTPTPAEIAQAYAADSALYAAREQRTVALVTVLDQAAANALAAKVRSGESLAAAARAAGLEPRTITAAEKSAVAAQTSPAAADAIFAAPQGGVVGPLRAAIGFVVARVDSVKQIPGRTLDQARPDIVAKLRAKKASDAIGRVRDAVEDALADNANINEVVKDQKLVATTTPALLANGVNPDQPGAPDAALAPIVTAGFAAEEGDTPTTVPTGQDGSFAIVALDRIVRAAPIPLASVRDRVAADLAADRARRAARQVAATIRTKVDAGTPLATALAQSGVRAPAVRPIASTRAQLNADPKGGVNPVLALLFSMRQGTAKMLESPDEKGWLVVKLDRVVPGDATRLPNVVAATRGDLGRSIGREYAEQFANAVGIAQGAKRNQKAIDQLKKDLLGAGNSGQ